MSNKRAERKEQARRRAFSEKVFAAEKNAAVVRNWVIFLSTLCFLLMDKSQVNVPFAYLLIAIIWPYGAYVYFFEPYRKFSILSASWFTAISDSVFISLWIFATGGFSSPYHLIFYPSILVVAFRFNLRTTMLTAVAYSVIYGLLLLFLNELDVHLVQYLYRCSLILLTGYFGSEMSQETLQQTEEKVLMQELANAAKKAESRLKVMNDSLEAAVQERTLKLEESMQRFRTIIEAIPQMAWTSTPEGAADYYNQKWYDYTGASYEQLYGYGWEKYLHPDDRERTAKAWKTSLATGEQYEIEYRWRRKDGQYRWLLGRAVPVKDKNGRITLWVGTGTDIHDQKLLSQALEQKVGMRTKELTQANEELARSNRDLEQFAYVASHDLKEPLRMISSYTQLLDKKLTGSLDKDAEEYMDFVLEGSQRMSSLINDLLDYSRVGRSNDVKEVVNINEILAKVLSNLQAQITETNAFVTYDSMPVIHGVFSQLLQLFQNLIANALKFHKEDENPAVSIACEEKSDEYLFSIKDNGVGIPNEYKERVFVIFQRLHNREKYSGTGIGLAICKKIVEFHGGQIWFESEVDRGTTFYFTLKK